MSDGPRDSFCALSGLALSHGEPVLAIPLAHIQTSGSPLDWVPIAPPALGAYDKHHHGAVSISTTPGGLLCARALGFSRVEALIEAARAGKVKEPKRPASRVDKPCWQGTGVALVRPEAWEALLDMPTRVGLQSFEPSESEGSLRADLSRAAGETVIWARAAAAAVERATGRQASTFPPAARLADRDALLFQEFSNSAVYMSKDLPSCPTFDAVFGHRAKGGVTFGRNALDLKTERLAMLTLPRMGFSDPEVEAAGFELCALAGANYAWSSVLGRRWAPSHALPAGRASRSAQWLWADNVRQMALSSILTNDPGDPHAALARARIDAHEIGLVTANPTHRARGPAL